MWKFVLSADEHVVGLMIDGEGKSGEQFKKRNTVSVQYRFGANPIVSSMRVLTLFKVGETAEVVTHMLMMVIRIRKHFKLLFLSG